MKSNKPEKSVAGMDVLKDIRGLLSTSREKKPSTPADPEEKVDSENEANRYKEEIKKYREQVQSQQEELERLTKENRELAHNLELLRSSREEIRPPTGAGTEDLTRVITQMEQREADLTQSLSELTDLLQIKSKELLKRIARVLQEAGEYNVSIEFRKGADSLENAENLARFLEILIGE